MTYEPTNTKTPKLSYSLLDGWSTCQLRTFYDRTGPRTPPTLAMRRGTQAHNAMEAVAKKIVDCSLDPGVAVDEVRKRPPAGPLPEHLLDSWLRHAGPMFKNIRIDAVERWFGEPTNSWGLRGRIDLELANTPVFDRMGAPTGEVRDGPCVLDYKTIKEARYCKQEWEVERALQAAIYSIVTGVRRFGYVYLLPNGEVRATVADIPEDAIKKHSGWLDHACDNLQEAWEHMRTLLEDRQDPELAFAPAPAGHPFCSPKCSHADKCPIFALVP
jgi:hypothetical protein